MLGALILACILGVGLFYLKQLRADVRRHAADHLEAVSEMKARLVASWREERLSDAFGIGAHSLVSRAASHARAGSAAAREDLREWCTSWLLRQEYRTAAVFDSAGEILASAGPLPDAVPVHQLLEAGRTVLSDFHEDAAGIVHADLFVPLTVPGDPRPAGLAMLRALPADRLFPLMQSWPTPSRTGQLLLVRRDDERAQVLFTARVLGASPVPAAYPLTRTDLPAVRAAMGQYGLHGGVDPKGRRVLASARPVPGTNWSLVAHLDEEEIDEPMRERTGWVLLVCAALSTVAVAGAVLWWQGQLEAFRRRQHEADLERMAVERHFSYLSRHTNDILLLADDSLRVVDANDRAIATYGFDREELLGKPLRDLLAPRARAALESRLRSAVAGKDDVFETFHLRRDGTSFPVEASCRVLEIEGERYYQNVIRDVTERRRIDRALRCAEQRLEVALEASRLGIWEWDVRRNELYVSPTLVAMLGYARGDLEGVDALQRLFHPEDLAAASDEWRRLLDGTNRQFEREMRVLTRSGDWRRILHRASVVDRDRAKRVLRIIGTLAESSS